jgi:parallel beta-helix repeat protein
MPNPALNRLSPSVRGVRVSADSNRRDRMPRPIGRAFLTALAVTTFVLLNGGKALANHVQCGDVITQDTTLDADLIDCPGDGLVIGADNVTLDLNGHTIDGDGIGSLSACDTGIANGEASRFLDCPPKTEGHDGVTIKDGVVRNFVLGVSLEAAGQGAVRGMTILGAAAGISLEDGSGENLVTQNKLISSGIGLREAGPDNRIQGNSVSGSGSGIYVSGFADGNRIEGNSISNNQAGIFLTDSFGDTVIKDNSVMDNEVGIWLLESQHTRIEGNRVLRSSGENDAAFSALGDGIHLDDRQNEIVGNVTSRNRDDGIEVALSPENTLARNTANRNGDLGIEAIPGVVDGRGNRAKHNGNPLQCLNVSCKDTGRKK